MEYLGKSGLVKNLDRACVFESNIMRIKLMEKFILPEYTMIYLNSMYGFKELRKNAKHAVNQSSINQKDVQSCYIHIIHCHLLNFL